MCEIFDFKEWKGKNKGKKKKEGRKEKTGLNIHTDRLVNEQIKEKTTGNYERENSQSLICEDCLFCKSFSHFKRRRYPKRYNLLET